MAGTGGKGLPTQLLHHEAYLSGGPRGIAGCGAASGPGRDEIQPATPTHATTLASALSKPVESAGGLQIPQEQSAEVGRHP